MIMCMYGIWLTLFVLAASAMAATSQADINDVPQDLTVPAMTDGKPAPGKRVRQVADEYKATQVHHSLYLPTDWRKGSIYPVIVEYAGNGPYKSRYGDAGAGTVDGSNLGYGISGGRGFLWVCMPYVSADRKSNQTQWWGDANATADYCKAVVPRICRDYGGDPSAVFIAGFSRGSIACNYIGLRDDEIAKLWRGFICHSHYDGVRRWRYAGSDLKSAAERLKRLKGRPQFISHENSVDETRQYLKEACPAGNFTFLPLPFGNHNDKWVLRDIPQRKQLRQWLAEILRAKAAADKEPHME